MSLTRRRLITAGVPALGLTGLAAAQLGTAQGASAPHAGHGALAPAAGTDAGGHASGAHASFRGRVDHEANGFHPHEVLRDFDYGRTTRLPGGRTLREWTLTAIDKEIEVAPGVTFAAWTYDGRIPGPTLRCTEGDRLRIRFVNGSEHPHTIHFHGIHAPTVDGVPGVGGSQIAPGRSFVYEFDAEPAGLHLYHCHVRPLAEHIGKGLYGAFIVDPKVPRPEADEMVMVMNGFDTNFDAANEVYAANTIGFAYMDEPIRVQKGELVRIFCVNILEFDLVNSFHIHGNLFDWYPTGTSKVPSELTDTVMLCQGQRGIIDMTFEHAGKHMFHAHQSEFTELGWMGFFDVCERLERTGRQFACDLSPRP